MMRIEMNDKKQLVIKPSSHLEAYALEQWSFNAQDSKSPCLISATSLLAVTKYDDLCAQNNLIG